MKRQKRRGGRALCSFCAVGCRECAKCGVALSQRAKVAAVLSAEAAVRHAGSPQGIGLWGGCVGWAALRLARILLVARRLWTRVTGGWCQPRVQEGAWLTGHGWLSLRGSWLGRSACACRCVTVCKYMRVCSTRVLSFCPPAQLLLSLRPHLPVYLLSNDPLGSTLRVIHRKGNVKSTVQVQSPDDNFFQSFKINLQIAQKT